MEVIIKNFEPHYNSALGKVITSRRQYDEEIKKGGYISYEEAKEQTEKNLESRRWKGVSEEAREWCKGVAAKAKRDGSVSLSGREIDALKQRNMVMDRRLPEHYRTDKGGFDAA